MGYQGHWSLTRNKKALVEPLSHIEGRKNRDTASLGFGLEDELPWFDRRAPMFSDLEDDDPPFVTIVLQKIIVCLLLLSFGEKNQRSLIIMLELPPLGNMDLMNLIIKILIEEG